MNAYEVVTDRIVRALEGGTVPWRKPWTTHEPENAVSHRPYRGVNVFLLACQPYGDSRWLTFHQAQELGGNIRRGEHGTPIILWKWLHRETGQDVNDGPDGTGDVVPWLRYYAVFNAEQCEGLALPPVSEDSRTRVQRIEAGEEIVRGYPNPPKIVPGDRAAYAPMFDRVMIPDLQRFESGERYYSTLFHELGHSTGHSSRLNRRTVTDGPHFGSDTYSREELVAEFTAAFLCGRAGIDNSTTEEQSAAYIRGWLHALKNDKRLCVTAAAQAQRAADYILAVPPA